MQVPGCWATSWRSVKVWSLEHVGVAALLAEVDGEGIARPHDPQPRVLLEARLRDDRARVGVGRRPRQRLAAAVAGPDLVHRPAVLVVLLRKVLAPDRRVLDVVAEIDHPVERVARLLLPLEDVHEERHHRQRHDRRPNQHRGEDAGGHAFSRSYRFHHCRVSYSLALS
jgi:hypothetical protein